MKSIFEPYESSTVLMEGLKKGHADFRVAFKQMAMVSAERAKGVVKALMQMGHRANRNLGGLRQTAEIPVSVMSAWAAKFKEQDEAAGIYHTTGWERWHHKHEFYQWFKKNNPEFFIEEEKSGNSIIVPATKYERVVVAKPQAQQGRIVPRPVTGPAIVVRKSQPGRVTA